VQQGENLQLIAYRHYGDCALWRAIADANRLTTVRQIRAGTQLLIPTT
jgi:nucleoid-associated protein YgaU